MYIIHTLGYMCVIQSLRTYHSQNMQGNVVRHPSLYARTYVCPKKCTVHTFIVLTRASSSSCRFSFGCMTSLNAALSLSIRCLIHITQAAGPDRVHHQSHIRQCTSPYSLVHLWPLEGLFHVLVQHSAVLGVPPLQYCAQNVHLQHTHMTQSLSLMGGSQHNVRTYVCIMDCIHAGPRVHTVHTYICTYIHMYVRIYSYVRMYILNRKTCNVCTKYTSVMSRQLTYVHTYVHVPEPGKQGCPLCLYFAPQCQT